MEILLVVIVVSILAGFILPNYTKTIKINRERAAADSLSLVVERIMAYKSQYNMYPNAAAIFSGRNDSTSFRSYEIEEALNFYPFYVEDLMVFCCSANPNNIHPNGCSPSLPVPTPAAPKYTCVADDYKYGYQLYVTFDDENNIMRKPFCNGTCPSCEASGCPWEP